MKFMYFKSWPVTLVNSSSSTSFFRHQRLVLGVGGAGPALLKVDEAGSVLESRQGLLVSVSNYSPWGHTLSNAAIGFKGEWFNRLTSSYPLGNGYRDYSAVIMRFRSPDSLSPMGVGGINPYAFVSDDPVNWSDPSGHRRTFYKGTDGTAIVEMKKGIFRKKRELYILGHGDGTSMSFDGVMVSPDQMYKKVKEKGVEFTRRKNDSVLSRYDRVYVVACFTAGAANDRHASFAQRFADKVGSSVRGYEGVVEVSEPRGRFSHVISWQEQRYKTEDFNYKPVDFYPRLTNSNSNIRNL